MEEGPLMSKIYHLCSGTRMMLRSTALLLLGLSLLAVFGMACTQQFPPTPFISPLPENGGPALPYPAVTHPIPPTPTSTTQSYPIATRATTPTTIRIAATPTASQTPRLSQTPVPMAAPPGTIAFIVGDWEHRQADSLWIVNANSPGERQLSPGVVVSQLAWSPDGKWLGLLGQGGLWVMSPDDTNAREIAGADSEKGGIIAFAWAPDSRQIAFAQQRGYSSTVYLSIADSQTGQITYLTVLGTDHIAFLTWSPDGQHLAFKNSCCQVGVVRILDKTFIPTNNFFCGASTDSVDWSPDGKWIAYRSYSSGRYGRGDVCVVDLQDKNLPINTGGHTTNPAWKPDGGSVYVVAVNSNPDNPNLNPDPRLMRFDINTRQLVRLASVKYGHLGGVNTLAISPNGQWISSLIGQRTDHFIYQAISLDGTIIGDWPLDLEILYAPPFPVYAWSADSQHLVFVAGQRHTPDGVGIRPYGSLLSLNIDTGKLARLTGQHWIKAWAISPK